jgi:hypothetical protein
MTIAKAAKHAHRKRESICINIVDSPVATYVIPIAGSQYRGAIRL